MIKNNHPYASEVRLIYNELINKKFDFICPKKNDFVEEVLAVDESLVTVAKDCRNYRLCIVLGNEPGVAITDFSDNTELDIIADNIYNKLNSLNTYKLQKELK